MRTGSGAPRVTLYPERVNHGFGRGNNLVLHALAARPTPPDKVFLLNPDAQLDNEAIAILADVLDQTPGTAICGCSGSSAPSRRAILPWLPFAFPT